MIPSRINNSLRRWTKNLPEVTPFYAIKCNPDTQFLKYLYDKGLQFDCASETELFQVKKLVGNYCRSSIIYANPCKSEEDINSATSIGSPLTVVDSFEELYKLKACNYNGGALIRIAVDDSKSLIPFSSKFGANKLHVTTIAKIAKICSINIFGFSFHIGSGGSSPSAYGSAIKMCRDLHPILRHYGHRPNNLDIGGGFINDLTDFEEKAQVINNSILGLDKENIHVIAEPGRFFASNSFDFYVKVIGKKYSHKMACYLYTIDDSLYGQFSCILFDQAKPIWTRVVNGSFQRRRSKGVIFGRTCDSVDVIASSEDMEELEVNDWLCFPNMGAYTSATASEFNGFPKPKVYVTELCLSDIYYRGPINVSYPSPVKPLLSGS